MFFDTTDPDSQTEAEMLAYNDERLRRVCGEAVADLEACAGDLQGQLEVCCRYFERGEREGMAWGDLIDLLADHADGVFRRAGYRVEECERLLAALGRASHDSKGRLQAPLGLAD